MDDGIYHGGGGGSGSTTAAMSRANNRWNDNDTFGFNSSNERQ